MKRALTIAAHAIMAALLTLVVRAAWPIPWWLLVLDLFAIVAQLVMIAGHASAIVDTARRRRSA